MNPRSKTSQINTPNHSLKVQGLLQTNGVNREMKNADDKRPISTIEVLMEELANELEVDQGTLKAWVEQRASAPNEIIQQALLLSKRYGLNPLFHQIAIEYDANQGWHAYIPIDGWIELIWRQKTLTGIAFKEGPASNQGLPVWMQCSIYRSDLRRPITVREYLAEVQTTHPIWVQMPHRMLRHKVLQQCARLAFGITDFYFRSTILKTEQLAPLDKSSMTQIFSPKETLKDKLLSI